MTKEYQSIMRNEVLKKVPRSKNKDGVSYKWLFKIKHVVDESIEKYKEIFVARGFS
jgi:glycine cleavage system H lipoate-binding protein